MGASDLDDILREAASARGRTLTPDPEPEKGSYYRSDHFAFARKGVPALYIDDGVEFIGKPAGYAMEVRERYRTVLYHRPDDEVQADWDVTGAVDDADLLLDVGLRVANGARWPEWKPGNEFRATREAQLGKR
jgi:Zn-dependent M28 family amino/carboxypeptidase